ncbi:MAG: hypothetical protein E7254_07210 [Lachnospiraceae bacterium]|nr:hypothetical protein [Lachnospiraceae bacterium]
MLKKILILTLTVVMSVSMTAGCGKKENNAGNTKSTETTTEAKKAELEDGVYVVEFKTDSSMFHVNEAEEGKGELTVKNGEMTVHISLVSKKIVNLFVGLAEDAKKDGASLLEPTNDTVTYSDGTSEEVFGFDVPVTALNEEFDLAILGSSGRWFDHKVSVTNPTPAEASGETSNTASGKKAADLKIEDGTYSVNVKLEGGSGRASVTSPCQIKVENGEVTASIEWSSSKYDFMMVNDVKYLPVNEDGNSVFEIPVSVFDAPMAVSADTTAMSKPYLIDYTLEFDSTTIK